jgi:hypothetical protein
MKHGQGEVAYYIAMKGARDLYVFQRAVRTAAFPLRNPPITATMGQELMKDIHPIKLCPKERSQFECWDRPVK